MARETKTEGVGRLGSEGGVGASGNKAAGVSGDAGWSSRSESCSSVFCTGLPMTAFSTFLRRAMLIVIVVDNQEVRANTGPIQTASPVDSGHVSAQRPQTRREFLSRRWRSRIHSYSSRITIKP